MIFPDFLYEISLEKIVKGFRSWTSNLIKKIFLIFFQQKDENKDSKANSYDSNEHEENGNGNVNKNGLDQPENGFR